MLLQLNDTRTVRADPDVVWQALHDTECLRRCVPGCRTLERVSSSRYDLSSLVSFGPVAAVVFGEVEIIESVPGRLLHLRGRGRAGVAGGANGTARITLSASAIGCCLHVDVCAEPDGMMALLGAALLPGIARQFVRTFGTSFASIVGTPILDRPRPAAADRRASKGPPRRFPNTVWR